MKKFFLLLSFTLGILIHTKASHIVGGEIEIAHYRGNVYAVTVKMYVDPIHATPGVIESEQNVSVGIFDKATNAKMIPNDLLLPRTAYKSVQYSPTCSDNSAITSTVKTDMIVFSGYVVLTPDRFNSPAGYYIVFNDCCRNQVIKNITNPDATGMAFYTEFPPVIKNGVSFSNHSPHFEQITGDFPCLNKTFNYDFSGTDLDGDSLVYEITAPLKGKGNSFVNVPLPVPPGPYTGDTVTWASGYSKYNEIPGVPSLTINPHTGMLHVVANQLGLYVVSVNVYEFRDGVKIGMVKRDFQFPVVNCPDNGPPSIKMELPNGSDYNFAMDTIKLHVDQDTCFTLQVSDSSTKIYQNKTEYLSLKVISSTLPKGVFTVGNTSVSSTHETSNTYLCINPCDKVFLTKDSTYKISIVVTDAPKCPASLAMYDTIDVSITLKPQTNYKPKVKVIQGNGPFQVTRGKDFFVDVYAVDPNKKDIITLQAKGVGFDINDRGMIFPTTQGMDSISARFKWNPQCSDLDPGVYKIRFIADDNSCISRNVDTTTITLNVADTTTLLNTIRPVNLFTPNKDGKNEVFEIPNIPDGNCDYYFKNVTIYNRWGSKVFESNDPHFAWDGENVPVGLYFYTIDIHLKVLKGWIEIIR